TRFTLGTTRWTSFPVLVSGQHYSQNTAPLKEDFDSVSIDVAPVRDHAGSGWAWLAQLVATRERLGQYFSLVICLALPIVAALFLLLCAVLLLRGAERAHEKLIVPAIWLALMTPISLWLAWQHQCDFSARLLGLARAELAPAPAFYLALAGTLGACVATFSYRRNTHRAVFSWWALVLAAALCIWLLVRFKPQPYLEIWNFISDGIVVTLRLVAVSFGLIIVVSLLGGLGRLSRVRPIYAIASLYVEIIRGIPLLVQLLFIWFALPQVFDGLASVLRSISPGLESTARYFSDLRLDPFTAAVTGFTLCYGAYGSEIFRAGISSIHRGQMEAARSLGMTPLQSMRFVILPQAVRVILPPIGNEFVALLKDSALVSVLAVSDLTRRGREYMARTFLSFDTWIMVALCYLVMTLFSSRAVEYIESKMRFER
ncbi:MAG: amino acid ABC transporter permease, partial [Chloroflexi bacterium]|nr:amino acid ABC transporter permease [Chloroflexota bacterium]